jgi:hypothetical protein
MLQSPVWRANYCLAPYRVSVLFYLALALLTGPRQSPATNSVHTTSPAAGEPRWSMLSSPQNHMEIAFNISELVLLESRLPRAVPLILSVFRDLSDIPTDHESLHVSHA